MNKKLAIMGHPTRGKEVIELLEMMGGVNTKNVDGKCSVFYFFIDNETSIGCASNFNNNNFVYFTLEEFLEKYPYKVGDKVFLYDNITEGCVTGMKWDEDEETVKYCVYTSSECWCDVKELLKWNAIDLVEKHYGEQCEEMMKDITLKHLYELGMENTKKEIVTRMDIEDASFILNYMIIPNKVNDELEYKFPDGYEFDRVDNDKIILKPIKPTYPNNFDDCFNTVADELNDNKEVEYFEYKYDLLDKFKQLLICRDAYWTIAGKEMGLDKPWKPDWLSGRKEEKYCIATQNNEIWHNFSEYGGNEILAFPTIEMRDAFYENFKDLIEQCKELL